MYVYMHACMYVRVRVQMCVILCVCGYIYMRVRACVFDMRLYRRYTVFSFLLT